MSSQYIVRLSSSVSFQPFLLSHFFSLSLSLFKLYFTSSFSSFSFSLCDFSLFRIYFFKYLSPSRISQASGWNSRNSGFKIWGIDQFSCMKFFVVFLNFSNKIWDRFLKCAMTASLIFDRFFNIISNTLFTHITLTPKLRSQCRW